MQKIEAVFSQAIARQILTYIAVKWVQDFDVHFFKQHPREEIENTVEQLFQIISKVCPRSAPSKPRIILICFFPSGVWDVRLPTVLPSPISILCREVCEAIRGQAQSDLQPPNNKVYTHLSRFFFLFLHRPMQCFTLIYCFSCSSFFLCCFLCYAMAYDLCFLCRMRWCLFENNSKLSFLFLFCMAVHCLQGWY